LLPKPQDQADERRRREQPVTFLEKVDPEKSAGRSFKFGGSTIGSAGSELAFITYSY
jgi:hypothetical protein